MEPLNQIDWWPSPAKINLFLHVCGRYKNGYHELETLFQLLDYGDEIGICVNCTGKIQINNNIEGLALQDNLIYKAAALLLPYRQRSDLGVTLHMRKNIPMGGGLGGGSSNAATVLVALNQLWQCELSTMRLLEMGLSLGADVPVFINGYSAFAAGVGEKLEKVSIPSKYYLVATPNEHIATASVFAHADLPRNTPKIDFAKMGFSALINDLFDKTQNDCEKLVCNQHPKVANLLLWLIHYAPSRMTGTGASIFAQFESLKAAQIVASELPKDISAFIAKGIDVSPLHEKLTQFHAEGNLS